MKTRYAVSAKFPHALAKHAIQVTNVEATNMRLACNRALSEILKRPGIKGGRHKVMHLTVVKENGGNQPQHN